MTVASDLIPCCTLADDSPCRSAGSELLSALEYDFSSWKDEESGKIRHTLYFATEEEALAAARDLESKAEDFASFGVIFRDFSVGKLKKEDWAESWKIHFKPLEISPRLAVMPSWAEFDLKEGQKRLVLDPGMSFGTGQHATTKSCLIAIDRFLEEKRKAGEKAPVMLDAGSGSGILAIAALLLGAEKVDAFDIDPDTLETARENARENGIEDSLLTLQALPLLDFHPAFRYEIVAANILSSALLAGKERLLACCKKGGILILAGILDKEYENVKNAFEATGLCRQISTIGEAEWRGGTFEILEEGGIA